MKIFSLSARLPLFAGLLFFAAASSVNAQLYWDTNNATTGFGAAGGIWAAPTTNNATQGWSSSSTGSSALSGTTTTSTTSALNFGSSTNQLGTGTITVSGSVDANSLTFVSSGSGNNTTLSGGNITLGGTTPFITVTNIANTAATTQTISSNITLGANQTWTANSGGSTGTAALTVSGQISGGFGITKAGNGTLTLSGSNSYTGATTVSAGVVNIRNNAALGTTAGSTTINSGAALQLQDNISVAEAFNVKSSGISSNGGIRNISGNNTISGLITLDMTTFYPRIASDAGMLTLSGGDKRSEFS